MASIDTVFGRTLLAEAHRLVRLYFPDMKLKSVWVYKVGRDHWEFHGPDRYYWHGSASGAYEARYKGWMAWLDTQGCLPDDANVEHAS